MRRVRPLKALLAVVAVLAAAGFAPGRALACGSGGYTYAGVAAPSRAFGIAATVTPLGGFDLVSGHIAGWVGVGGPGMGPAGTDEWLQVGFSRFPDLRGNALYYELTLPSGKPTYHQIAQGLPFGRPARVAVLEMRGRPNVWQVWLDRKPVSGPIYMPGSHARWAPIATAEAWTGAGTCNSFLYRFEQVSVATSPGGGWLPLAGGFPITSSTTRIQRRADGPAFLAGEGPAALRTLASLRP